MLRRATVIVVRKVWYAKFTSPAWRRWSRRGLIMCCEVEKCFILTDDLTISVSTLSFPTRKAFTCYCRPTRPADLRKPQPQKQFYRAASWFCWNSRRRYDWRAREGSAGSWPTGNSRRHPLNRMRVRGQCRMLPGQTRSCRRGCRLGRRGLSCRIAAWRTTTAHSPPRRLES